MVNSSQRVNFWGDEAAKKRDENRLLSLLKETDDNFSRARTWGLEASMRVRTRASFNPRGGEGSFPSPYFSFGCFLAIAILNICNNQLNIFYIVNLFYWPYLVQVNVLDLPFASPITICR